MATKRLDPPRMYTLQEVADAARVTRRTIYRWVSAGRVPQATKVGKQWLLSEAALRSLLAGMALAPSEDPVLQSGTHTPTVGGRSAGEASPAGRPAAKKSRRM